jgi:hypothetical protein
MNEDEITREINKGHRITERLCQELNIAISSWAHFEAINGESDQTRHQFRQAMHWLQVSHKGLLAATIRDAILALCRIVDDPRPDGFSLIELSRLLNSEELRTALIKNARLRAPRFEADDNANSQADKCNRKIELIRDHVPLQWNTKPKVVTLRVWRNDLIWPLRNKVLAHPGDTASIVQPKVDQIRDGLELINELVSAAHHIFVGSPLPTNTLNQPTQSANKFWNYAQIGFIDAFEKDQAHKIE